MSFIHGMWRADRPASVHCNEKGCKEFLAVPVKGLAREESVKAGWVWRQDAEWKNPQDWLDYCPKHKDSLR